MNDYSNIFIDKRILIYGLGKSGTSALKFLKKKNKITLFDDNKKITLKNKIIKSKFDLILLSPGINKNKCKLKNFLKRNSKIIYTDLDVFKSFYNNECITITGTNGKSTTCQLLYEVLKKQGYDVKLAGNIGYPILSIKNIKPKSIFVIEASSYQLQYSKIFRSKYSAILNISPDHLERHKTLKEYVKVKFKLIKNQLTNSIAFVNKYDVNVNKFLKKNSFKSKIIKVNTKLDKKYLLNFKNNYFLSASNKENLLFVLEIIKRFKINKKLLIETISNFKGLRYRQQIIYNKKDIKIINDSKSTSFSSSKNLLQSYKNIYWLVGGKFKKGDKFILDKKYYKNIKVYIYGSKINPFKKQFKNKVKYKVLYNIKKALIKIVEDSKNDNSKKIIILFSPAAASFDHFRNFEERGKYFNNQIKILKFIKKINDRK